MAKKKTAEAKVELERVYNIPLRKEFQKAPKHKRAKKAVTAVRNFLEKHMKSNNVKIGKYLNLDIWKHGIKNPPHHIKVNAKKDSDGKVSAEIIGAPVEKKKAEKKGEKKPAEEKKDVPKEEVKTEEMSESKIPSISSQSSDKPVEKKEEPKVKEKTTEDTVEEIKKKEEIKKESPKPRNASGVPGL